jgi:hypothetical protein
MTPRSRLTFAWAAGLAALALATPAFSQAGSGAVGAGAPQAPTAGNAETGAAQPPPNQRQPTAPNGCPYRDGKLELIV